MDVIITLEEYKTARQVYWWLLLAPVVAVPCWASQAVSIGGNFNFIASIWAAAIPLVFYLPIFTWMTSNRPFLRAHATQGAILLGLRCLSAILVTLDFETFGSLLIANFLLWLGGGVVGLDMVKHKYAWMDNIHATVESATPTKTAAAWLQQFRTGTPSQRAEALADLEKMGEVEVF